jgi:hypothetical protein
MLVGRVIKEGMPNLHHFIMVPGENTQPLGFRV